MSNSTTETSFHRLVRSLLNDTIRVELDGNATTKSGKLVDVDRDFITIASEHSGGPGGSCHLKLVFIPFRKIVTVVER